MDAASNTDAAPTIASFTASPKTLPIGGGTVNLEWTVVGATSTSIDQGVGDVSTMTSKTASIAATTTFTLTATNAHGSTTATAMVSVAVESAPFITAFTAMPSSLPFGGGATTLTWTVSNASSISIDQSVGDVTNVANKMVSVTATTTFTLTATNAAGSSTQTATVTVGPDTAKPSIVSFTNANDPATGGGPVTLNWVVNGATSLSLADNVGHTQDVTGLTTAMVQVPNDLSFTLTATNVNGAVNAMLSFAVPLPPYLKTLAISAPSTSIQLGMAYDSILGLPTTSGQGSPLTQAGCVTFPCGTSTAGQTSSSQTVHLIQSDEDYLTTLQIDASASLSAGPVSASDKFQYYSSHQLNSSYVYLWVDLTNITGTNTIANVSMIPSAQTLDPTSFFVKYGDRYAEYEVTGGEIYGLLEIQTQSTTEKQNVSNTLSVSSSGFGTHASVNTSVATTLDSTLSNYNVVSYIVANGYNTASITQFQGQPNATNSIAALFSGLQSIVSGPPTTSPLQYLYASYFGISGYPGLPANVPALVAQHQQVETDYLAYAGITTRSTDFLPYYGNSYAALYPSTSVSGQILGNLKSYTTQLQGWLSAALVNSLTSGPEPTPVPGSAITDFTITSMGSAPSGSAIYYDAYRFANGFVPAHEVDYDIPARYAGPDGTLNGIALTAHSDMATGVAAQYMGDIPWQLYLVDENIGGVGVPALAYRWSNQVGEFYLTAAVSNGTTSMNAIGLALGSNTVSGGAPTINRLYYGGDDSGTNCNGGTCETNNRRFVWVNMGSGQVMTSTPPPSTDDDLYQSAFTNVATQWWDFVDVVGGNPATWTPFDPVAIVADGSGVSDGGQFMNLSGDSPYLSGNAIIDDHSFSGSAGGNEIFLFYGTANGYYNIYLKGSALTAGGVPENVVGGGLPANPACTSTCFTNPQQMTIVSRLGYANERWHLVPMEHVYTGN
jgi:hypothetical protein